MPRRDLTVTSHGVTIRPSFALGGYAAFARYPGGHAMVMGDLVVTEAEAPAVTDALQAGGLQQTAIHKHLLAESPPVWWMHINAMGDPLALARAVKAAVDAGSKAAAKVGELVSSHIIARPHEDLLKHFLGEAASKAK